MCVVLEDLIKFVGEGFVKGEYVRSRGCFNLGLNVSGFFFLVLNGKWCILIRCELLFEVLKFCVFDFVYSVLFVENKNNFFVY